MGRPVWSEPGKSGIGGLRMTAIGQKSGKTYREIDVGLYEERKKRLRDRIYYWEQVKAASIPGGKVREWAEKRIRMLKDAIIEMDAERNREALANEEKPEDCMGAVGGPEHADAGAGD